MSDYTLDKLIISFTAGSAMIDNKDLAYLKYRLEYN